MAVLALLAPVHGLHKKIHEAKEDELCWVNGEISKQRSSFQNPDTSWRSGKMADLVAYRSLVERVPEWPFTTSTYTRLILYALLPLVTWGIGLIAEEFVGRLLH